MATLVRRTEGSLPRSAQDRNHGLGWLITHVKLLTTVHDNDRSSHPDSHGRNDDVGGERSGHYVNPEHDSTANLVKRLLLCCPRLEVFLDAAPYGFDELPRSVLTEIGRAPLLYSSSSSSSHAVTRRRRISVGVGPYSEYESKSEVEGGNHVENEKVLASSEAKLEEYLRDPTGPRSRIRSLEWGYGSPSISELLSYPPSSSTTSTGCRAALGAVTQSVRVLRCNALSDSNWVFSTVQGTLRPEPAIQYDRHLMEWASSELSLSLSRRAKSLNDGRPMLWMPKLVLLDMFLSARSHLHWATLVAASTTTITLTTPTTSSSAFLTSPSSAGGAPTPATAPSSINGLPSLTHLTVRTPSSLGTIVGSEAIASLHVFLKAYGSQLKSLDLRVTPGDVEPNARLPDPPVPPAGIPMHPGAGANGNQDPVDGMLNIPLILARCPNLEELVLSARWPSPHSFTTAATTAAATAVVPPHPPNVNNPNGNPNAQRQNPSPFAIPHHDNLRRIGLRDTTPHADGFSSSLASRSCPCCRRVYTLSSASELVLGGFMGGGGSNFGAEARNDTGTGTGTVSAQMPYRPRTPTTSSSTTSETTQHPFPSTLIESLLNGALLSNAYSLHETFPSSSTSRNGRNARGQHGKGGGVGGVMSHRHCTIDRHFRMMLSGVIPLGEPAPYLPPFVRDGRRDAVADMLAAADGQLDGLGAGAGGHGRRQSQIQMEEDILRRRFGAAPRFPKLETIQLLDSQPSMFSNVKPGRRSRSSSSSSLSGSARSAIPPTPVALALSIISHAQGGAVPRPFHFATPNGTNENDHGNEGSTATCGTTCWCIPLEARVEMNFWGAWAARCEARGVKLLDRAGKTLPPVYADFPACPTAPLSITASTATVHSSSHSLPASSLLPPSSLLSVNRGPSKLENMDLEDELNLSIIRAALLRTSNGLGLVTGLWSSARPFIDTYAAVSALVSLTLRSKGPSDMTLREVVQRLLLWFAEHGMINATSEYLNLSNKRLDN